MTADELLLSVKRRAFVPTSQVTFTDAEILSIADEAMQEVIVPAIMSVREEFYVIPWDQPIVGGSAVSGTAYRVPSRAVGSKVRTVSLVDADGKETHLTRLDPNDLEFAPAGFYVQGGYVVLFSTQGPLLGTYLRMRVYVRPGALVITSDTTNVRTVASKTSSTLTHSGAWAWVVNGNAVDVIRATNPFDLVMLEAAVSGISTATFTPLAGDTGLAKSTADVSSGVDWVCLTGYTPVVQAPTEAHPVLAQAVAVKLMEALGDAEGMGAAQGKLDESIARMVDLLSVRTDGSPKKVVNRFSPYRRRW